jgi:8-oxo-dGTP pyrophosphatase MutT (NUDIX family)
MQYRGIYSSAGVLAYRLGLPVMRLLIKRTERVYVMIEYDKQVLLIKNWLGRQGWQLPGGGRRPDETARQAGVREIKEELGIRLAPSELKLIKKGLWQTDGLGFRYSVLKIKLAEKPVLRLRSWEIVQASWVPINQASKLPLSQEVAELFG